MTRDEHLEFCKKCQNRKFDAEQGIICRLTGRVADFEGTCESFLRDESVKDEVREVTPAYAPADIDMIQALPDTVKDRLRPHQDLFYAVVGGSLVALVCALVWAMITVRTEFQIAYMAIGVGALVGFGVRFFGAGIDKLFGYIGAGLALAGCLLGNLFSQVGFVAEAQSLGYLETLTLLDFDIITALLLESFHPMDLLFYGLAVVQGYKLAFRPIQDVPPADLTTADLKPPYSNLRLPLVICSLVIISFTAYSLSKGVSGEKTFYYESGAKLSEGEFVNGKETGDWTYYYENGQPQLIANFANGFENGTWQWYDEEGMLTKKMDYKLGLLHGPWIAYHTGAIVSDSGRYENGRMEGDWVRRYPDGTMRQRETYHRDMPEGTWEFFNENGRLSTTSTYQNGKLRHYESWHPNGGKAQELDYTTNDEVVVLNAWDSAGVALVTNGNGTHTIYHKNGTIAETVRVVDGKRQGKWLAYYADGSPKEEGDFSAGTYKMVHYWSADGTKLVTDGQGHYTSYHEGTTLMAESGLIENGLRAGRWIQYYETSESTLNEMNYVNGELDGEYTTYYENGEAYAKGSFLNGEREGEWSWYYENTFLQTSVTFREGKKQGAQSFWSETGVKVKEEHYEDGEFTGETLL